MNEANYEARGELTKREEFWQTCYRDRMGEDDTPPAAHHMATKALAAFDVTFIDAPLTVQTLTEPPTESALVNLIELNQGMNLLPSTSNKHPTIEFIYGSDKAMSEAWRLWRVLGLLQEGGKP